MLRRVHSQLHGKGIGVGDLPVDLDLGGVDRTLGTGGNNLQVKWDKAVQNAALIQRPNLPAQASGDLAPLSRRNPDSPAPRDTGSDDLFNADSPASSSI